jgi:hypothetical protein
VRHASRHSFSRSYGVSLPSSLTRVLSRALEYSSRPPESVCGTGTVAPHSAAFLGSVESPGCEPEGSPHHLSASCPHVCPCRVLWELPTGLNHLIQQMDWPILLRPCSAKVPPRCWNINQLAIVYASRPRLRSRLTHGRLILPQETLGLRRPGF